MHARKIHIVLSVLFLTLNLAVGPGIVNLAYAQQNPYGEDRHREENERERAREEGSQEEQEHERDRQGNHEENQGHRGADCNVQWDHCVRNCNTVRDAYQREACVGSCNNELQGCKQR